MDYDGKFRECNGTDNDLPTSSRHIQEITRNNWNKVKLYYHKNLKVIQNQI